MQLALAAGAGLVIDVDDDLDPRQVRRQGSTIDATLAGSCYAAFGRSRILLGFAARCDLLRLPDRVASALPVASPTGGQSDGAAVP